MDFDAPPAAASGADQAGVRLYNERLILSLVRRNRQLSKVEVARTDRPFRADRFGDDEPPAIGRPAPPRGAATWARRSADCAPFARSRGRFFAWPEDREAEQRTRAGRFQRQVAPSGLPRPSPIRPRASFSISLRPIFPLSPNRCRLGNCGASPGWASRRRFNCGTGAPRSARRRLRWKRGGPPISRKSLPRSARFRSRFATTPRRPARPNFSLARRGGAATSSTSFSAPSSAAASSSTARCFPAAPETPARSARCR